MQVESIDGNARRRAPLRVAVLQLTGPMRNRLLQTDRPLDEEPVFSGPMSGWKLRRRYLAVFVDPGGPAGDVHIVGLGIVVPGNMAGTYERRIGVEDFGRLNFSFPVAAVADAFGNSLDELRVNRPLRGGEERRVLDAIREFAPSLNLRLDELESRVSQPLPRGDAAEIIATQRDMTGLLLVAHDIDRKSLRDWAGFDLRADFLDDNATPEAPHEDDVIRRDWLHLPGWFGGIQVSWTEQRFVKGQRTLSIFYGNTRELERQTGVDLVYYNEAHGCFVCVQYKKLKHERGPGWVYRPDQNLRSELERMRVIDEKCLTDFDSTDIRLVATSTFFKLHEPIEFEPGSTELTRGMYLTREHFELLLEHERGVNGGRRIGYSTVPRHLNNTMFAELLSNGWIGSRGAGTDLVGEQVRHSFRQDRAVVVGVTDRSQHLGNGHRLR